MDFSDSLDIDDMFNIFQTKLLKTIDKHAPFQTLSQWEKNENEKNEKNEKKLCITEQILAKIIQKNKTYKNI